ncbi:MAG: hypothetical protein ABI882_17845, partial [Acidobacteriota bacterium]
AWLGDHRVADAVSERLHHGDGTQYKLDAFCIISNHVHCCLNPLPRSDEGGEYHPLSAIMHSLKLRIAREANRLLKRSGPFWERESFDHFIRMMRNGSGSFDLFWIIQ